MRSWGEYLAVQGISKKYFKRYVLCEVNGRADERDIAKALERTCRRLCGDAFYHLFSFSVAKRVDGAVVVRVRARAHDLGLALLVISLTRVNGRFLVPIRTSGSIKELIIKNKKGGPAGSAGLGGG